MSITHVLKCAAVLGLAFSFTLIAIALMLHSESVLLIAVGSFAFPISCYVLYLLASFVPAEVRRLRAWAFRRSAIHERLSARRDLPDEIGPVENG